MNFRSIGRATPSFFIWLLYQYFFYIKQLNLLYLDKGDKREMDIKDVKEVQELMEVLQVIYDKIKQFGKIIVKHLYLDLSGTKGSLPLKIYNTLNDRVKEMEQMGIKPILVIGDDTDSYLSCYLYNLLRGYDGYGSITLGGVLIYKGKDKGIHLDTTHYKNGVGLVFLDTDIVFPNNSVSLSNHINLMYDDRILNINNYLGCNSLEEYKNKYPLGTTQILLSVCKSKGVELPQEIYDYFLRSDMSRLPKNVFMSNTMYYLKVLDLDKEFKRHLKEVKKNKKKGDYKLFTGISLQDGELIIHDVKYPVIKMLKEFNSPHSDVRLSNLKKVYDLDTVVFNTDDDGVLIGNVDMGVFTIYKKKKEYYYTKVSPVNVDNPKDTLWT